MCGETTFLEYKGAQFLDGGYSSYDDFEDLPDGWFRGFSKIFENDDLTLTDLCPSCKTRLVDALSKEIRKIKEGKIAVLVSPGYGCGWSTWNSNPAIAYDKRIIEYMLDYGSMNKFRKVINDIEQQTRLDNFLSSIGYPNVYRGGAYQLEIEWIDPGKYFRINVYDGSEELEFLDVVNQYMILY